MGLHLFWIHAFKPCRIRSNCQIQNQCHPPKLPDKPVQPSIFSGGCRRRNCKLFEQFSKITGSEHDGKRLQKKVTASFYSTNKMVAGKTNIKKSECCLCSVALITAFIHHSWAEHFHVPSNLLQPIKLLCYRVFFKDFPVVGQIAETSQYFFNKDKSQLLITDLQLKSLEEQSCDILHQPQHI